MFHISKVCPAFRNGVGTKVLNKGAFFEALALSLGGGLGQRVSGQKEEFAPGQFNVVLGPACYPFVSSGVGRNTDNLEDYVLRAHRGKVGAYLRREFATPVTSLEVTVYTREAYNNDPDVKALGDSCPDGAQGAIVSVRAGTGPSPLSPVRFVHNLAGGNNAALAWTAEEIRSLAEEINGYWSEWTTVSD